MTTPKRSTRAKANEPTREVGEWWTPHTEADARDLPGDLVLDTDEPWHSARQPWQETAHAMLLGLGEYRTKPLTWIDGPTGCGKDQLIAAAVLCLLHYAPPGFRAVMYSTDHDRSRDVIETTQSFCRRTESVDVKAGVDFTRDMIRHKDRDVIVECVATDGASASGARADLFLLNEVQSWADPHGLRVWTETLARYRKKKRGRFAVLSNAPFTGKGDWRRDAWERARSADSGWNYMAVRLKDCPWIDPTYIEEQRKNLPDFVFRRLFMCEPTDGRGELVTAKLYDRCVYQSCAPAVNATAPGVRVVGVDVGLVRDHAVVLMLRIDPAGAVYLERIDVWIPDPAADDPKKREVQIAEVEAKVLEYGRDWKAKAFLDPYQAVQMEQSLTARGVECERVDATPKALMEMATAVTEMFRDGRVRLYPSAGAVEIVSGQETSLRQQLLDAELKETERGVRIVSKRTKAGHGDQASAFALAALGVARHGVYSVPVCVGSTPAGSPTPRGGRLDARRWLTRPATNRFIGPRAPKQRITA